MGACSPLVSKLLFLESMMTSALSCERVEIIFENLSSYWEVVPSSISLSPGPSVSP